jgi:hypothetical protein
MGVSALSRHRLIEAAFFHVLENGKKYKEVLFSMH